MIKFKEEKKAYQTSNTRQLYKMPRILKETYQDYIFEQEYLGSKWESYVMKLKMNQLKILVKIYEEQGAMPISEYNDNMIKNE